MYATMRQYTGIAPATFETLMSRKADIESLIRKVPGFVQYDLVRTADGITSFTVCADKNGTETSNKQVADWIGQNVPDLKNSKPVITTGEDFVHFNAN